MSTDMDTSTSTFSHTDLIDFVSHLGTTPFESRRVTTTTTQAVSVDPERLAEATRIRNGLLRRYTNKMAEQDRAIMRADYWWAWLIARKDLAAKTGNAWTPETEAVADKMLDMIQCRLARLRHDVKADLQDYKMAEDRLGKLLGAEEAK